MLYRCENPKSSNYKHYGGRGIGVCEEWHDLKTFAEWSYQNGFDEATADRNFQLDRIDTNADYCPDNCRWVDVRTQQNNKTSTVFLDVDGKRDTLANWARAYGIDPEIIRDRIRKLGWDESRAVKTPKMARSKP